MFATVTGRQDAYIPKLDEVKTRVADDVKQDKAVEMAKQRAAVDRDRAEGREGFRRRREARRPRDQDHRARRARLGDSRPRHQRVDRQRRVRACRRAASATRSRRPPAPPIVRVVEKVNVTDAEIEAGKDQLRDELVNARRDKFFGAYMQKAKQGLKITTREDTLARVVGS